jgi:AraC-like DNA-binding protein
MRVTTLPPDPDLAPFVRCFHVVATDAPATRVLVPELGLALAVRSAGSASLRVGARWRRLPAATLSGLRMHARTMRTSAGGGTVVAQFHPGGASAWFATPLHDLFGEHVALADVAPPSLVARAVAAVGAAADDEARANAVATLLRALPRRAADAVAGAAVRTLEAAHGRLRIADLARDLGFGRDRFEKRFRATVGCSPKQFASLVRLRRAFTLRGEGADLTRAAHGAGYHDQSHFVRDFRRFLGEAPRRFFATVPHCSGGAPGGAP